jgi:cobalamin biosynthesis protein CobD/CbiB
MRDWVSIIIALLVVLALTLGAIQLLTLGRVAEFWSFFASWIVATGTLLLAFSTQAMAEATRRSVEETQRGDPKGEAAARGGLLPRGPARAEREPASSPQRGSSFRKTA